MSVVGKARSLYFKIVSARDLLLQVKALSPTERRSFMEAMADLNMDLQTIPARLRAPDFDSYWRRLRSLGMPAWTAEQTADFDRWLAGAEDGA